MQVNQNIPMRSLYIVALCGLLGLLFCIGMLIGRAIIQQDYVEVQATITDTSTDTSINRSHGSTSVAHYVRCSYEWMGDTRSAEFRTFFTWGKSTGNTVKLRVSPSQPGVIADPFVTEVSVFLAIFLAIVDVVILKTISIRRKLGA